jgi:glycosyltransferase involved in cell wall biosynthesis
VKILYHHRVASKDGQFVHIEELVRALERRGHEVRVVGPEAIATVDFGSEAGLVARLKRALPPMLYELAELAYGCLAWRRLERACREFQPDALYERYSLHLPAGALLRRRRRLPFVLEVNAPLALERSRYGGLALPGLARRVEGWTWRSADRVCTVTRVLAGHIEAARVDPERIVLTPNGIDPARFAAAPDVEAAKGALGVAGRRVVGFTGFMREWHGLDRIVSWLAERAQDDVVLLLVGDGPARAGLEAQARALGIADRVLVTGVVGRDAVAAHVTAFDVALQAAVVPYASPLKLFEYMALGRAIVAPDSANIREVLEHGRTALLVPETGVTDATEQLLADAALRQELGRAARRAVESRGYTWDANAARVETAIREVLDEIGFKGQSVPVGS